jgi:hypothetical protein
VLWQRYLMLQEGWTAAVKLAGKSFSLGGLPYLGFAASDEHSDAHSLVCCNCVRTFPHL